MPLRRSRRDRRPNHTVYDDAVMDVVEKRQSVEETTSGSRSNKKKRERDPPSEEEQEDSVMASSESEQEEEEDSSSSESETEAYSNKRAAAAKPKKKQVVHRVPPSVESGKNVPASKKSRSVVSSAPTTTKAAATKALKLLAERVLEPSETPDTSLVAALLLSVQTTAGKKAHVRRSHQETWYTAGLQAVARQVVTELGDDQNAAQIRLYNLLFRSVGGSTKRCWNAEDDDVDVQAISAQEWSHCLSGLVDDMQHCEERDVLLCADPQGAVHAVHGGSVKPSSLGVREYRKIYEEFWFLLAKTALNTESGSSNNNPMSQKAAKSRDSDDSSDDSEDEDGHPASGGGRFSVELVRDVVSGLIELVGAGQPDIRAAACSAVYRLGLGMLEHTVELSQKVQTAQRQLTAAQKNKKTKMSAKAQALKNNVDIWKRTIADLESMVNETVVGVFLKRYKDANKYIRADSLKIMGLFSLIRPDLFLVATYLKYFGWMLSDKEPVVRECAIFGLLAPFREASKAEQKKGQVGRIDLSNMTSVIKKFLPRLADLVLDVDIQVQERAMELLLVLERNDFLEDLQDDDLWKQINLRSLDPSTSNTVRRDSLYFVLEQLETFYSGPISSETKMVECIDSVAHWVAHVLAEDYEVPLESMNFEVADYVVVSLRSMPEHKALVTNWSALLKALANVSKELRSSSSRSSTEEQQDRRVDAAKQRVLLRMLVCAVEQEVHASKATDEMLSKIVDKDLIAASKEDRLTVAEPAKKKRKATESTHEEVTLAVLKALPDLLESYKTEPAVLEILTKLPLYFLPSVFNLPIRKRDFEKLLSKLSGILLESTDLKVMENCVLDLTFLAKTDHSRKSDAFLRVKEVAKGLHRRLIELLEEMAKLADENKDDSDMEEDTDELSSVCTKQNALRLCLQRLVLLTKRWNVAELLCDAAPGSEQSDKVLETFCTVVAETTAKELQSRKMVPSEGGKGETDGALELPEIWSSSNVRLHPLVADSVTAAMTILLVATSARLKVAVANESEDEDMDEDSKEHIVLRMRQQLLKLLALCFELYLDDKEGSDALSAEYVDFAYKVQAHAGMVAGDLRAYFPKLWHVSESPLLRSLSLFDDSHIVGGFVRFINSQEAKLRQAEDDQTDTARAMLMPLSRGLSANWKQGNRREAGVGLTHITGSGPVAQDIMSNMSRVLKKIEPVRLLEAHMAALRQEYEMWVESEPDELESERPTEDEMNDADNADKLHKEKFAAIEHRAGRLAGSLGVGKLSDARLVPALGGFLREGIRFAFSTDDPDYPDEDLPVGARLTFLSIIGKYLMWVRKNTAQLDTIRMDLNQREGALRKHPDFSDIYPEDLAALTEFRRAAALDEFVEIEESSVTDEGEGTPGVDSDAASFRRRLSRASSISTIRSKMSSTRGSLSPLAEEDSDSLRDSADTGKSGTPTPMKNSHTMSVGTGMSRSTAGGSANGSSDDDGSSTDTD